MSVRLHYTQVLRDAIVDAKIYILGELGRQLISFCWVSDALGWPKMAYVGSRNVSHLEKKAQ